MMYTSKKTSKKSYVLKAAAVLLVLAMLCFTAACGGAAPDQAATTSDKSEKDLSLSRVLGNGQLIIGIDENYPPIGFKDENGQYVGFDIDVARETCFRMGIDLVVKSIDWSEKDELLDSREIDCIWNGMSVSPEREKSMTLSVPYMQNQLIFMVTTGSDVRTFLDLEDKRIGVQRGTTAEDAMANNEKFEQAQIIPCRNIPDLFDKLSQGEVDAILVDSIVAYYYVARTEDEFYSLPECLVEEKLAIGFRKGDIALRDRIQKIMYAMNDDGTLAKISEKWFGGDITTLK